MRFLKLKKTATRSDGSAFRQALVVDAPRRFAPENARKYTTLSKKKCHLITGAHDSGKSRWLSRIQEAHSELFGAKAATPVFLGAIEPLASWVDCEHIAKWHDSTEPKTQWRSLNQHQRAERLADYIVDTGAILYVDDAHKLTGRKCQVARRCMLSAKTWFVAASDENRLPPNIRTIIERREPQRTQLESDASYDSTALFMWMLAAILAAGGAWEVAAVLAGLQTLGSGRRSARAD
nr:hypothetical protein [Vibrio sp. 10N.286.46.E10]PMI24289.1 hypothetical protein BCU50_04920 [Vibrio sp. 10N.286.46.E10]